ncbi:MAG: MFS transporter [Gammaproteobacteria bacterium]|nr:MFS transporter [Gammaproteobacteria bacterium]NNJ72621.1 MFS transporter [Enterobacterales bacterium]
MNDKQKGHPFRDLIISIIIPSVILMKFSGDEDLGSTWGLIVALAFPFCYGLFELIAHRKFNFISLLGVISVLLTGGIGLLELDPKWLAIKEAAIPLVIGLLVLISLKTPYPLIRTLLYNPNFINTEHVDKHLKERGNQDQFDIRLVKATYFLSCTFLFSATLNYFLATYIVTSPAGTEAFNEELGQLTLVSYPVIALPSMVFLIAILYWLIKSVKQLSGLPLEEIMLIEESTTDNKG